MGAATFKCQSIVYWLLSESHLSATGVNNAIFWKYAALKLITKTEKLNYPYFSYSIEQSRETIDRHLDPGTSLGKVLQLPTRQNIDFAHRQLPTRQSIDFAHRQLPTRQNIDFVQGNGKML